MKLSIQTKVRILMVLTAITWGLCCACVVVLLGCGAGGMSEAEATPKRQLVRLIVVNRAIDPADLLYSFDQAANLLIKATGRPMKIKSFEEVTDTGSNELLTLDHFWDGSLRDYWFNKYKAERKRGAFIVIAIPPLKTPGGPMYGGWSQNSCAPGDTILINVEQPQSVNDRAYERNWLAMDHEFGHGYGARDRTGGAVNGVPEIPTIMNADAMHWWKIGNFEMRFDWPAVTQMKECLGRKFKRGVRGRALEFNVAEPIY